MGKMKVFMIMPFQEVHMALYERLKKQFSDDFTFEHADDFDGPKGQQSILKDIMLGIGNADVVVADVSGLNANVMYELGVAHALAKKVIHITQDIGEMSFDIRPYRALEYSTRFDLIDRMDIKVNELMQSIKNNSGDFNNPVTDYWIGTNKAQHQQLIGVNEDGGKSEDVEEEPEFLDLINDIEEGTEHLTELFDNITVEMQVMTTGVNEGTRDIEKVSKNGGSGNTSYIRKTAQKLASFINAFALKLHPFNNEFQALWDKIDNGYAVILSNTYLTNPDNIQQLANNAKTIKELNATMYSVKIQFETMNDSVESSKGFERQLSQACNALSSELQRFIDILDTAIASTDRIYERSIMLIEG